MIRTNAIVAVILALPLWLAAWLAHAAPPFAPWAAIALSWGAVLIVWRAAAAALKTQGSWRKGALAGLGLAALLLPFAPLAAALAVLACCLLILAALMMGRGCHACGPEPLCATLALPPVLWLELVVLF